MDSKFYNLKHGYLFYDTVVLHIEFREQLDLMVVLYVLVGFQIQVYITIYFASHSLSENSRLQDYNLSRPRSAKNVRIWVIFR